ncbi:DMT family transporter [Maridesulfovibrio sp. FT414]|uniref:DMT family transporter n=1 Tax=Maridesulfovibrio sp. FT414 TaxID=2979469 RepID=UPI003D806189
MQYWLVLGLAICLEVAGTISMKFSQGFTRLLPSILLFIFYGASFTALTVALKRIDVGIAYAIWAGLGTALISILGVFFFKEPVSILKAVSVLLIILGVIGLNMSGVQH